MRGVTILPFGYAIQLNGFQLTRLMRGVTRGATAIYQQDIISTHTPHARRDVIQLTAETFDAAISTHTPHARRDCGSNDKTSLPSSISTHTPHARRDRHQ